MENQVNTDQTIYYYNNAVETIESLFRAYDGIIGDYDKISRRRMACGCMAYVSAFHGQLMYLDSALCNMFMGFEKYYPESLCKADVERFRSRLKSGRVRLLEIEGRDQQ